MKKQLKMRWSKRERDILISWPDHSYNGAFLWSMLRESNFRKEMEDRGYDITTLKFSIDKKKEQ